MNLEALLAGLPASQDPTFDFLEQQLAPHGSDVAARTAIGEAESEGDLGQRAVIHAIRNRAQKPKEFPLYKSSPRSIEGIAKDPFQFSVWNEGDPRKAVMESLDPEEDRYQAALEHARKILAGRDKDPTGGATYFKRKGHPASWETAMEKTAEIGKHEFFKKPRKPKK